MSFNQVIMTKQNAIFVSSEFFAGRLMMILGKNIKDFIQIVVSWINSIRKTNKILKEILIVFCPYQPQNQEQQQWSKAQKSYWSVKYVWVMKEMLRLFHVVILFVVMVVLHPWDNAQSVEQIYQAFWKRICHDLKKL